MFSTLGGHELSLLPLPSDLPRAVESRGCILCPINMESRLCDDCQQNKRFSKCQNAPFLFHVPSPETSSCTHCKKICLYVPPQNSEFATYDAKSIDASGFFLTQSSPLLLVYGGPVRAMYLSAHVNLLVSTEGCQENEVGNLKITTGTADTDVFVLRLRPQAEPSQVWFDLRYAAADARVYLATLDEGILRESIHFSRVCTDFATRQAKELFANLRYEINEMQELVILSAINSCADLTGYRCRDVCSKDDKYDIVLKYTRNNSANDWWFLLLGFTTLYYETPLLVAAHIGTPETNDRYFMQSACQFKMQDWLRADERISKPDYILHLCISHLTSQEQGFINLQCELWKPMLAAIDNDPTTFRSADSSNDGMMIWDCPIIGGSTSNGLANFASTDPWEDPFVVIDSPLAAAPNFATDILFITQ